MHNFSIGTQIEKELADFRTGRVRLASVQQQEESVRLLKRDPEGYYFNQAEAISLIDLYYNSKFEGPTKDKLGQRKIFMNVGKFRTQVAAKQVDIDTKNFRFLPDDYADPWTALFMQKEFKEWAKDSDFGDLVNVCVDNYPKYGTVVMKKVGKDVKFVPLQNLRNEQTAESLQTAKYVIEEHPDLSIWEIKEMAARGWNVEGLTMKYDEVGTVFERYGYVPLSWLKKVNGEEVKGDDDNRFVDAMVICMKPPKDAKTTGYHIFYASQISKRPYREKHWDKQHGRWLGMGVMEDLIENQQAKNIVVNLIRRSLHWSSKRVLQSASADVAAKNLVRDVEDGTILEVGANGAISDVNLQGKTNADFQNFLAEFEKNSDQKAFTYEVATGESLPSGTPFRLGVILSNAVNSYFGLKREKLGLFLKEVVEDFKIPQFLRDMSDEDHLISYFSDEPGFEALKEAAMQYARSEATRITLLSGKMVDADLLMQVAQPYELVKMLFFNRPKMAYKEAKVKFDFTVTGEEIDLESKLETLKTLYQVLDAKGDPRAEKVLQRIAALSGENLAVFGSGSNTPNNIKPGAGAGAGFTPAPKPNALQPATT